MSSASRRIKGDTISCLHCQFVWVGTVSIILVTAQHMTLVYICDHVSVVSSHVRKIAKHIATFSYYRRISLMRESTWKLSLRNVTRGQDYKEKHKLDSKQI